MAEAAEQAPAGVDPTRPSPARMYDYMLGGTRNLKVDRDATERFLAQTPDLVDAASANRGFLRRAARYMAGQGIRQFIDIGSGLPAQNNTHEAVVARYVQTGVEIFAAATEGAYPRPRAEIARFFAGLDLVPPYGGAEPDLTNVGQWGAEDPAAANSDGAQAFYCGVARKP
jgi:S-adenosyl methyltransferase